MRKWLHTRGVGVSRWAAEIAGVLVVGAGAWLAWEPAGFIVVGGYLVLLANSERPQGGRR